MTLRISLVSLCALLLAGAAFRAEPEPWTSERTVSDSARDELSAGRFWHAARVLRAEGAADGSSADVLTLAQAEAGWENWPAVLDLLRNASWLGYEGDGEGYALLGRSLEHAGEWGAAASTYLVYLEFLSAGSPEAIATRVRLARTAWWAGDHDVAMDAIAYLRGAPHARSWIAAELALAAADSGDVASVRRMIDHAVEPAATGVLWRAEADALLTAGDSVEAAEVFATLVGVEGGNRRASAMVELGRLRVAAGDTAAGRRLLLEGFHAGAGRTKTRAAETLTELGNHDFARTLEFARVLDRAGDGRRALIGYDRAVPLADAEGEAFPESSRLERARIMSTVEHRQAEALAEFREIRETAESERGSALAPVCIPY